MVVLGKVLHIARKNILEKLKHLKFKANQFLFFFIFNFYLFFFFGGGGGGGGD